MTGRDTDAVGRLSRPRCSSAATRRLARRHRHRPRAIRRHTPRPRPTRRPRGLLDGALAGTLDAGGKEILRGQMLVEMAAMSIEDGLVMQLHPGSRRNHNRPLYDRLRPRHRRRHPRPDRLRRRPAPAARPLRQRPALPARRCSRSTRRRSRRELAPLAGALPGPVPRPAVVVPRQRRGHAPVPPAGHRDGRLRQHRRLRRRHPRVPVDPGPPRRRPARRLSLPRRAGQRPSPRARRRPRDRSRTRRRPAPPRLQSATRGAIGAPTG